MSGRRSRWTGIVLVCALLPACGGGDPLPRQSPGTIEGELVSTDDALPEEFPRDLPLPGAPTVLYSAVSAIGSVVYLQTEASMESILQAFLAQLPEAGWKVYSCTQTPGSDQPSFFISAGRGRAVASISIGYLAANAERIDGRSYSYFVSVADDAPEPTATELRCVDR